MAPKINWDDLTQTAALPLGSWLKIDPWDDSVHMLDAKRYAPMNARDKMPFEVTPIFYKLQRYEAAHVQPPPPPLRQPHPRQPHPRQTRPRRTHRPQLHRQQPPRPKARRQRQQAISHLRRRHNPLPGMRPTPQAQPATAPSKPAVEQHSVSSWRDATRAPRRCQGLTAETG